MRLRRRSASVAGVLALAVLGTGCGGGPVSTTPALAGTEECAPFREFEGHGGKTVTVVGSIVGIEAVKLQQAWRGFADCTGITVRYEGTQTFETDLRERLDAGDAPDLALVPQPGLLADAVADGHVVPAPESARAEAQANWSQDWLDYGTVEGTFYAAPFGSSVKSFVWYSPSMFREQGLSVPETWEELLAVSDALLAAGVTPWCAGLESGDATGWTATDWVEDVLLRTAGPEVYDDWVAHDIPFDDPAVVEATDLVGSILKNPAYVNGGWGGVDSVASTSFLTAGLPVLDGSCGLHRQASFYASQWPRGTDVSADGDVDAFYFPPVDPAQGKPVLAGGEFVSAFDDRPEVQAFQTHLASAEFATRRVALGSWVSANANVPIDTYLTPIDMLSAEILRDPEAVVRFDGSDLMPATVGAGSFWTGMTAWVQGVDTATTLAGIEASWPS